MSAWAVQDTELNCLGGDRSELGSECFRFRLSISLFGASVLLLSFLFFLSPPPTEMRRCDLECVFDTCLPVHSCRPSLALLFPAYPPWHLAVRPGRGAAAFNLDPSLFSRCPLPPPRSSGRHRTDATLSRMTEARLRDPASLLLQASGLNFELSLGQKPEVGLG